jgi:hypothetical protein
MKISLAELEQSSIYNFSSEGELLNSINLVSNNFVFSRDKIKNYGQDPRLVSAYYQFYLPTNVLKFEELLKRIPREIIDDILKSDFIDFGCGPGTFTTCLILISLSDALLLIAHL